MCSCLIMTSECIEGHVVVSSILLMSYTPPLVFRRLILIDITTEQEVYLSDPALG